MVYLMGSVNNIKTHVMSNTDRFKTLDISFMMAKPKTYFYQVATTITNQDEFRQGQTCAQGETMPRRRMAKQSTFHKPYFNNSQFIHYHVFLNCYSC